MVIPVGQDSGIVFLKFSIIVVTQDSNHLELLSFMKKGLTPGEIPQFFKSSRKFNFDQSDSSPIVSIFFQQISGRSEQRSSYDSVSYWAFLSFQVGKLRFSSSNMMRVSFSYVDNRIFMTGVRIEVLITSRTINQVPIVFYSASFKDSLSVSRLSEGINKSLFGFSNLESQQCMFGLEEVALYFYYSQNRPSSFIFRYKQGKIHGADSINVWKSTMKMSCFALCPS